RHYTPPPHAAALHRAGALLPAWWSETDDMILAPSDYAEDAIWLKSHWGLSCNLSSINQPDTSNLHPQPWGWSEDARRQFSSAGIADINLPSDDTIATLRRLSHRRSSIIILQELDIDNLLPEEVTNPDRVLALESESPGRYIKSPWSCSGRGVFCTTGLPSDVLRTRVQGIINRQGSVMVEKGLDKITDFASLFYSDGTKVEFRGLSLFLAEQRGLYTGNIVAPQEYIYNYLAEKFSSSQGASLSSLSLPTVISNLERILTALITPHYQGWLGIDMMIYRDRNGSMNLHPCIELNLRRTMGVTAMHIAARLSVTTPYLLTWHHARTAAPKPEFHPDTILLPTRDNFTLTLTSFK
ncbi:hypothetical protein, partial [uncultured Duncaniella sp.]